jgi:succinoglycan biosynthesis transport protein ExoP
MLMGESGVEPTLHTYLTVLRRRRWWVVTLTLLGLGAGLALSLTQAKQYSATAQLLVQSPGGSSALNSSQTPVTSTDVQTELQLVTSAQVEKQVRSKLGSAPPVSAAQVGQTNVIGVTAVSTSPARAALVANTYAKVFVDLRTAATINSLSAAENQLTSQINDLSKEIGRLPSTAASQLSALSNQAAVLKGQLAQLEVAGTAASTSLEFVTPAQPPASPSSPKPVEDALLGLVIGLLLGLGAAFLRDNLDDSLNSADAAERVSGSGVLAAIPMISTWKKQQKPLVASVSEPTSPAAEAYRSLRTSLQFARQGRPLRTILVTSPNAGEGKTATVANLGAVFAQAGERVVLVSGDLRRPRLSSFFEPEEQSEVVSVLLGQQSLEQALSPVPGTDGLWMLGARAISPNPTELLSSDQMRAVFDTLKDRFDVIIIDSPPVLPVSDALILTGYADAVLLVAAAGQTRRNELKRTAGKLAQANAPVLGIVLNKVTRENGYGGYGYGGYGGYRHTASVALATPVIPEQNGGPPASPGRHGVRSR